MEEKEKEGKTIFCKHCGEKIPFDAVICTHCGRQVEDLKKNGAEQIVINNTNTAVANASATAGAVGKPKNKWITFFLCLFFGTFGIHKFYEGKVGMGLVYLFTFGFVGIGVLVDLIVVLFKPTTYYV